MCQGPASSPGYTQFYILGPRGIAGDYPTRLNASQDANLTLVVVNNESKTESYTIRISAANMSGSPNSGVTTVAQVTLSWLNFTLDPLARWTLPYSFRLGAAGLWKIELNLYLNGNISLVYRHLHLFLNVAD